MPFISTNTWVLKILDGTMSHKMKALGGYALYDEAFAGAREDAFDPATELSKKHAQFLKEGKVWFIKDASSTGTFICVGGYKKGAQSQPIEIKRMQMFALGACVFKVANIERIGDTAAPEKGATAAEKKRKKKLDAKRSSGGAEDSDDEEAPPSADDDDDDSEEIVDSDDEKEAAAKRKSAANSEKPAATLHLKATTKKGKLICFGKIDYEEGAKFTIGKAPSGNKIPVPEEHAAVLRVDDVHCARRAQFGAIRRNIRRAIL